MCPIFHWSWLKVTLSPFSMSGWSPLTRNHLRNSSFMRDPIKEQITDAQIQPIFRPHLATTSPWLILLRKGSWNENRSICKGWQKVKMVATTMGSKSYSFLHGSKTAHTQKKVGLQLYSHGSHHDLLYLLHTEMLWRMIRGCVALKKSEREMEIRRRDKRPL